MKRILRRLRKQLESTKAIETMLKSASLKSQLDNLFIEAIKVAHTLLDADRGTLWLVDDQTNELWTRIAEGMDPIRIPKSKGIVGWVVTKDNSISRMRTLTRDLITLLIKKQDIRLHKFCAYPSSLLHREK